MSQLKIKDGNNWVNIPAGGIGVPSGGNTGDVLVKSSSTDYATEWEMPLSIKLLWTNPTPTATFAPQTVALDLSGYDMIALINLNSTTGQTRRTHLIRVDDTYYVCPVQNYSGTWYSRTCKANSAGIDFDAGINGSSTDNNSAIPVYIYGIKGIT